MEGSLLNYSCSFNSRSLFSSDNPRGVGQRSYADVIRLPVTESSVHVSDRFSPSRKRPRNWNYPYYRCCFRCGGSGHFAKDCRNMIRCFYCGGSGHRKRSCPEFFSGRSVFDFLHFNCLSLCRKLLSFLNLFDLAVSNQKSDGAYMLLQMGWHIEGIVDGILWSKRVQSVSRFVCFPPLPNPLGRKEHALSFCLNFLKVRRIFFDSISKSKRKGFFLLNEILLHFDSINTVVNCGSESSVIQSGLKGDDALYEKTVDALKRQSDKVGNREDTLSLEAVNGVGNGSMSFEEEMISLSGSFMHRQNLDTMFMDHGAVMKHVDICNLVVENQLNSGSGNERAVLVKDGGGVLFAEDEIVVCVGRLRVLQHFDSMLLDPCVLSCVHQPYGNSHVVCPVNVRVNMSGGEMDSSDSSSVECSINCDETEVEWNVADEVSLQNGFGVLEDVGEEEGIIVKDHEYGYASVCKGGKQIASDKVVAKNNSIFARPLDKDLKLFNNFGVSSKYVFDANKFKRRRNTSFMKHDLWACMNKGICKSLALSTSLNSHYVSLSCDQLRPESLGQFRDLVSEGLKEGFEEKSPVGELALTSTRRSRRKRVYPRSGLLRRSKLIRSYTVYHDKFPS